jgi:hypothetical protein
VGILELIHEQEAPTRTRLGRAGFVPTSAVAGNRSGVKADKVADRTGRLRPATAHASFCPISFRW